MKNSMVFSEKENQKTLSTWHPSPGLRIPEIAKVFCFFSSEKKTFVLSANP
jgi:hypothetical protein